MVSLCLQVQSKGEDDEQVARAIADKLGDTPGVSYSDVANKALEVGRNDLAIRVCWTHFHVWGTYYVSYYTSYVRYNNVTIMVLRSWH
ncbi:hypothetical protein DPMN_074956 [Dreissena polymorpha]|uniref:Uncharacterized protein n=1 Tax=Dreissena polymorpha TaxID=45954 RepID=A0A9D4BM19_DREPO|nr:hypothetical protein DPMN_074956 [Dreissena polymorpha]